jgi:hypothetical protein
MLDVNEAHQAVETINGNVFNTSILRKLQLYPAQTGELMVDAMQLQNSIEFNDSMTGEKIRIEKFLASKPVSILVKPLPPKQPAGYGGAVGKFTIAAGFRNSKIETNSSGRLEVSISGQGNFIQFAPPVIDWPKGFDVFEPEVLTGLNKSAAPAKGTIKYAFNFSTNHTGSFKIPPIIFYFFDPALKKYKKITSDSLKMEVIPGASSSAKPAEEETMHSPVYTLLYFLGVIVVLLIPVLVFWRKKKKKKVVLVPIERPDYLQKLATIINQSQNDNQFCSALEKLFHEVHKEYALSDGQKQEIKAIRNDCQLLAYSNVQADDKKEELQRRAQSILREL